MFSNKISLITFLAFVGVCNGLGLSLGSCPDTQGMPNFDLEKYMGMWYTFATTEPVDTCNSVNYTLNEEDGSVGVLNKGSCSSPYNLGVAVSVKNAQLKVTAPLLGITSYDNILDTDYSTYSVVQTCNQISPLLYSTNTQMLVRNANRIPTARLSDYYSTPDEFLRGDCSCNES